MERLPADTKLENAKQNLSGAIMLLMLGRWHNAWVLAQIALQVISDHLKHEGLKPYLEDDEIIGTEFADLGANSRQNLNAVKHADNKKRLNEGVYHANSEDALFCIHISILELMKLETDLLVEHQLFIGWYRQAISGSREFPCPDWALNCFSGLQGLPIEEQCRLGLLVFLEKGVPPIPSRDR